MNDFVEILQKAQAGQEEYIDILLNMYKPLLIKESVFENGFNEDLFQELHEVFLGCLKKFKAE